MAGRSTGLLWIGNNKARGVDASRGATPGINIYVVHRLKLLESAWPLFTPC